MKWPRLWLAFLAAAWLALSARTLRAEDWTTTDGKVYQDVKVIRAEPDAVTILHQDGGGLIPLADLPADLQQRFHYDPAQAKAAADARAKESIANGKALQAEMNEASDMRQPGPDPDNSAAPDATPSPTDDSDVSANSADSSDTTHHPLSELDSLIHSLGLDSPDPTHHSMDELTLSAAAMRPDLADPSYHTMAHLAFSIQSLGPDPSDRNHHTISEIDGGGL